jgi:hypothetical protein
MKIRLLELIALLSVFMSLILIIQQRLTKKNRIPEILAGLSVFLAILILIHQKLANNFWFSWPDFWHHEAVEACFVSAAVGLLVGKYLGRG